MAGVENSLDGCATIKFATIGGGNKRGSGGFPGKQVS